MADAVGDQIVGRIDRHDARHGEGRFAIDPGEARMRVRRAHEQHSERVGGRGVVGIASAACQEPLVLASRDRLAELGRGIHVAGSISCVRSRCLGIQPSSRQALAPLRRWLQA